MYKMTERYKLSCIDKLCIYEDEDLLSTPHMYICLTGRRNREGQTEPTMIFVRDLIFHFSEQDKNVIYTNTTQQNTPDHR